VSIIHHPLNSLKQGHWFKLICGASYQHLPSVRNLTLAYALAGADCIDVAADPAVIASAKAALQVAEEIAASEIAPDWQRPNPEDIFNQRKATDFGSRPMLMVSLNDGEDPHFRKAEFDPAVCPPNCPRPCEKICPAEAIAFPQSTTFNNSSSNSNSQSPDSSIFAGVIDAKCYGCGRCVPVCPLGLIQTRSYVSTPQAVAELVLPCGVDAVEIHTQVGRLEDFKRLWTAIAPWVHGEGDRTPLKLIAISCPDGENLIDYLWSLYQVISPLPCPLIWQTDGRPMSGDIGAGTTHASIKLGQKVLGAGLPGYVQLAGGTNHHTVSKLRSANLLKTSDITAAPPWIRGVGGIKLTHQTANQQSNRWSDRPLRGLPMAAMPGFYCLRYSIGSNNAVTKNSKAISTWKITQICLSQRLI
jgi:Fe-S-cluster-containing hydrogenase component 2